MVKGSVDALISFERLQQLTGERDRGKKISPFIFIRERLRIIGRGYSYEMWKEWREINRGIEKKYCNYSTFRKYIWNLEELGLIEFVPPTVPSSKKELKPRRYYALIRDEIDSIAWLSPLKHLAIIKDWNI